MESSENTNPLEKAPVSDRKREANRRNAQKSTGPRTARGKGYSARNAITHGHYAEKAKLELCREEEQEFADLCSQVQFDLSPVGVLEELEVQRIAMFHWKMLRLWRYENAVVGLATHHVVKKQVMERGPLNLTELFGEGSSGASQTEPCSKSEVAGGISPVEVGDANAGTSSAPAPGSFLATALSFAEAMREEESLNIESAEIDREAVPDPVYLDIIHRAHRAAEKGLNDAIRRFKSMRKWRLKIKITDGQLRFDQNGNVII